MTASKLITLFTDAGFCPNTKIASYAVWAKVDGTTLRRSGLLRGQLSGADVAELRALANGVALVLKVLMPEAGAKIIAQTDCQAAINALLGTGYKRRSAKERVRVELEEIRSRLQVAKVEIEYRHVRGHRGAATPRNAVNTWCDRECSKWLREGRASHGSVRAATASSR